MHRKLLITLLFYLVTPCVTLADDNGIIQLGTKVEWKPYHVDAPNGADGTAVRMVACILTRMGQPFKINQMPWARVQLATKHGSLDGFFSASRNSERDSYATLTHLFIPQKRVFYLHRGHLKYDINNYDVAFIKQNAKVSARDSSNALRSLESGGFIVEAHPKTQIQLLNMLDNGRIEAVLENSLVFENLIKDSNRSMSDYLQVTYQTRNMGVYFGHKFLQGKPHFIDIFNRNIMPCTGKVLQ